LQCFVLHFWSNNIFAGLRVGVGWAIAIITPLPTHNPPLKRMDEALAAELQGIRGVGWPTIV